MKDTNSVRSQQCVRIEKRCTWSDERQKLVLAAEQQTNWGIPWSIHFSTLKMAAVISQQADALHRIFQRNSLPGGSGLVFQLEEAVKNCIIRGDQPGGKLFQIDFRQSRHKKPPLLIFRSLYDKSSKAACNVHPKGERLWPLPCSFEVSLTDALPPSGTLPICGPSFPYSGGPDDLGDYEEWRANLGKERRNGPKPIRCATDTERVQNRSEFG
jgi:hypothetical protein